MTLGAVLQWSLVAMALVAGLSSAAGVYAPKLAPDLMTMETMEELFGTNRYEDRGTCDFWVVNMTQPNERIERDFACSFYWDWSLYQGGNAYVHEALVDLEQGEVFRVPHMDRGNMEEWYHVDGHMLTDNALAFTNTTGGDAGVLMPPPGARGELTMGWVSSGGIYGGPEQLIVARPLIEQGNETIEGLETIQWESHVDRARVSWHGYDVYLSEDVSLASDPKTGWVLEMYRHVLVEMTPGQMAEAFGLPLPADPGGLEPIMELTYQTTPGAIGQHAEENRGFRSLMAPIEHGDDIARVGGASAGFLLAAGLSVRTLRHLPP